MLRNQPTLPPIYKATTTLSAETIVDRALAAVREPGPLERMLEISAS